MSVDPTIVVAAIGAIATVTASLAGSRNAKRAAENTNGALHGPLARIEEKLECVDGRLVNLEARSAMTEGRVARVERHLLPAPGSTPRERRPQ